MKFEGNAILPVLTTMGRRPCYPAHLRDFHPKKNNKGRFKGYAMLPVPWTSHLKYNN